MHHNWWADCTCSTYAKLGIYQLLYFSMYMLTNGTFFNFAGDDFLLPKFSKFVNIIFLCRKYMPYSTYPRRLQHCLVCDISVPFSWWGHWSKFHFLGKYKKCVATLSGWCAEKRFDVQNVFLEQQHLTSFMIYTWREKRKIFLWQHQPEVK